MDGTIRIKGRGASGIVLGQTATKIFSLAGIVFIGAGDGLQSIDVMKARLREDATARSLHPRLIFMLHPCLALACQPKLGLPSEGWRRGSELNRRIRLLQSPALPLGYPAIAKIKIAESQSGTSPNWEAAHRYHCHRVRVSIFAHPWQAGIGARNLFRPGAAVPTGRGINAALR